MVELLLTVCAISVARSKLISSKNNIIFIIKLLIFNKKRVMKIHKIWYGYEYIGGMGLVAFGSKQSPCEWEYFRASF